MSDGCAAATYAVVVDTLANIITPVGQPKNAVRLLMKQEDAQALWQKLGELFG